MQPFFDQISFIITYEIIHVYNEILEILVEILPEE